jgi:hypothetical protein
MRVIFNALYGFFFCTCLFNEKVFSQSVKPIYKFENQLQNKEILPLFDQEEKPALVIKPLELPAHYFQTDRPINYPTYFNPNCYPKSAQNQIESVVRDYLFNKLVIRKLLFSK